MGVPGPVRTYKCVCAGCGKAFTAKSPRAKWHAPGCKKQTQREATRTERTRAARDREAAATEKTDGPSEHRLVTVTRRELDTAGVLDTVDGQIALVLARRAAEANASGVSTLMRELRTSIAEAKASKPAPTPTPDPDPTPTEPPTKLEEARLRREQKARQAADRA